MKNDIMMILRDVIKDAGIVLAFVAVVIGSGCFINNYKGDIFGTFIFSVCVAFWEMLPLIVAFIGELLFSLIFFGSLHLSSSMKHKNVILMVVLIAVCTFVLFFISRQIDSDSIVMMILELIYMSIFLVPLFIHSTTKKASLIIVSMVLLCNFFVIVSKYQLILIIMLTLLFIILRCKNTSVNITKVVIINLLLIQSLDLSMILSLRTIPSNFLLIIGFVLVLYKSVVFYFRYKKYKEKNVLLLKNYDTLNHKLFPKN